MEWIEVLEVVDCTKENIAAVEMLSWWWSADYKRWRRKWPLLLPTSLMLILSAPNYSPAHSLTAQSSFWKTDILSLC